MPETDTSENVLREYFHDYYRNWKADLIDIVSAREIGFIPFFGTMVRHRAVLNLTSLTDMMRRIVPRHTYYSTAYYRKPEEKVMKDKEWLGAELIFDLDADHIPGAEKMSYTEILSEVKKHTHRLIFRFLMDDLGFQEKDLKIFFSGGRGYHVHVVEDSIYSLGSDSRREIANYIRGEGFSTYDVRRSMQEASAVMGGWKSDVDRLFVEFLAEVADESSSQALSSVLGNRRSAEAYIRNLSKQIGSGVPVKKRDLFLKPGSEKYRHMDANDEKILTHIISKVRDSIACEIDEPVTTDVHRLIRTPGSLHGKTGFIVKHIPVDGFDSFDPLRDAIYTGFNSRSARVDIQRPLKISIAGENFSLDTGEAEIPGAVAVYAVASRYGKFL
ncbi:MAG: DNA primase catalytic subunit PriS [Candidatus Thermoplasmatota archaeon]|nr:DNA primase catalytic subunit PriS [Candidatus Thermoplasmatota archaeon]